ncbi:MAG: hypothetical protein ACTHNO_19750 [Ralstonia sp.]|uniref:hypothetical protein n=1 Tax=Ralstonia sp. TaxID=54061 RepID=UPI003F80E3F2
MNPVNRKGPTPASTPLDREIAAERPLAAARQTAGASTHVQTTGAGPLASLPRYASRRRSATPSDNAVPEADQLAEAFAASLHWQTVGIASFAQESVGPLIGAGSQKDVYRIQGDPTSCLAVIRPEAIGRFDTPTAHALREVNALAELRNRGFRTVQIRDLVRVGDRIGIKQNYLADALGSSDIVASCGRSVPEGKYLTQKMVEDCSSTIETFRRTSTVVDDLQFLVEPSGDTHISDPRGVAHGNPQKNIGTVKELRGIALATLLSSDEE